MEPAPEMPKPAEGKKEITKKPLKPTTIVAVVFIVLAFGFFTYMAAQFVMERQKNNDATKQDSNINKTSQPTVAMAKSASVTFVKGDVTYMEDETADPVVLETTTKVTLDEGGMIKTGSDALAIITMPDQSVLRLNADTEVVLTEMSTAETTITNSMGQVYARVASSSKPFNTVIDDAMFSSLGTAYMSVNTEDMQTVDVYEGSVKKSAAEKTTAMSNSNKYVLGEEEVIISQGYRYYLRYRNEEKKNDTLEKLNEEEVSQNEFVNWNLKEDLRSEKYSKNLGVLDDLIGRYVVILSPRNDFETTNSSVTVTGKADPSFNLTLNGEEIKNVDGNFTGVVELKIGKNEISVVGTIGVKGYSVSDSVVVTRKVGDPFEKGDDDDTVVIDDSKDDSTDDEAEDSVQSKDDSDTEDSDSFNLTTSSSSTGIKVSWKLDSVNSSKFSGLRIIYSNTHKEPVYPGDEDNAPADPDSYVYVSMAQTGSQLLKLTDGKKYYIRMCSVNREDLKCGEYSSVITQTAP